MADSILFTEAIKVGYANAGPSITLGAGIYEGTVYPEAKVNIPLRMLNRHGLISGATGSGKTKTLQIIVEQLAIQGVPSLLMDIKGDLSGIAAVGEASEKILQRMLNIGIPFVPHASSVEFLSLSGEPGARLRATLTEFGPVLLSKILGLNDTQQGVVALVFKYCDDKMLPLLDLDDFKKTLLFLTNEGKDEVKSEYGAISSATTGTIIRKLLELEQQDAGLFFGEPSFEVDDLKKICNDGEGKISIIRLTDLQTRPKLFSTFMLQLLAEVFSSFPEAGDVDKPRLCIFIDEAHLIFDEASKALLDQINTTIKLIRSKGVGIFFITQNPSDVPAEVLSQLGLKIQHALRAFTAKDRKDIKLTSENFPLSDFYDIEALITSLGIGEALITVLNEKGIPTPLVHTMLRAPESRMDILTQAEIDAILAESTLIPKYNKSINRVSAFEILNAKLQEAMEKAPEKTGPFNTVPQSKNEEGSLIGDIVNSTTGRQIGRTVAREITRSLLGVLGLGGRSRRTKRWF